MKRFEREVVDFELIDAMLKEIHILNLGMNDADGFPYVVPLNFGYEFNADELRVYIHCMKLGKKVDLIQKDNKVCCEFSIFNDFPDRKYKGHYHDFRSVIAKGTMTLLNYEDDSVEWEKGYHLLYTCNNRDTVPLDSLPRIPNMYIGVIVCDKKDVTAKAEFPIRTVEDVPFKNVYEMEKDDTPFDIKDIILARKERLEKSI